MSVHASSDELLSCRRAVREATADLQSGDRVLVACSGGPDSLALVAATTHVAGQQGISIGAVIVDHGLQDDSAEVAADAAETCRLLGAEPVVVRVEVGRSGGPEAAAREARYAALAEVADRDSAVAVLLGHTLEDQAETVLLRLARGSGARSLAGMPTRNGRWRRPFLALSRATVRAAAHEVLEPLGREPWRDPHNADSAYARVRVRAVLDDLRVALGDGVVLGLSRSAELLRDDADALDHLAQVAFTDLVVVEGQMRTAEAAALKALPAAVRTRVIRMMVIAAGCPADDAGVDHIRRVDEFITQWRGQGEAHLPGGVRVERSCGRLCVHSSSPLQPSP